MHKKYRRRAAKYVLPKQALEVLLQIIRRKTDLKCDSRTCTKWFFGCFEFRSVKTTSVQEINAIMKKYALKANSRAN
jgi:hypothetical protein